MATLLSGPVLAAAVAGGLPLAELLKLLAERLIGPLPPLLEVALRAWAAGINAEIRPFSMTTA